MQRALYSILGSCMSSCGSSSNKPDTLRDGVAVVDNSGRAIRMAQEVEVEDDQEWTTNGMPWATQWIFGKGPSSTACPGDASLTLVGGDTSAKSRGLCLRVGRPRPLPDGKRGWWKTAQNSRGRICLPIFTETISWAERPLERGLFGNQTNPVQPEKGGGQKPSHPSTPHGHSGRGAGQVSACLLTSVLKVFTRRVETRGTTCPALSEMARQHA